MAKLPSLPVIFTSLGCLLALVVGTAFRLTLVLQGSAEAKFLPNSLRQWLYDLNHAKKLN
jgi:hypothetical protein